MTEWKNKYAQVLWTLGTCSLSFMLGLYYGPAPKLELWVIVFALACMTVSVTLERWGQKE
jgi:hypothetical protein